MAQTVLMTIIDLEELKLEIAEAVLNGIGKNNHVTGKYEQLVKVDAIAKELQVSVQTVHNWKNAGLIPYSRIANKVFFRRQEVINAMKKIDGKQK